VLARHGVYWTNYFLSAWSRTPIVPFGVAALQSVGLVLVLVGWARRREKLLTGGVWVALAATVVDLAIASVGHLLFSRSNISVLTLSRQMAHVVLTNATTAAPAVIGLLAAHAARRR
jgi:hypothetical protein